MATTISLSAQFSNMLEFSTVDSAASTTLENSFLPNAEDTVTNDEPGTPVWYGLKRAAFPPGSAAPPNQYAIFDIFFDEAARTAHNSGNVSQLFAQNSTLFTGGATATLQGVKEYRLVTTEPVVKERASMAEYLAYTPMTAVAGREDELRTALINARSGPESHEGTSFWAVLEIGTTGAFAMVDMFDNASSLQDNTNFNRTPLVQEADGGTPHLYTWVGNSRKDNFTVTAATDVPTATSTSTAASVSVLALTVASFVMRMF